MPKVIIHGSAGASNGDASVWQIVSQARGEVDGDTALGACNEHLLTIFSFKIFVISVYLSATAVGVCLPIILYYLRSLNCCKNCARSIVTIPKINVGPPLRTQ